MNALVIVVAALNFARPGIQPDVMKLDYKADTAVEFDEDSAVSVSGADPEVVENEFDLWFGFEPEVKSAESAAVMPPAGDEAYSIEMKPGKIVIAANAAAGARYAVRSLRQAAIAKGGSRKLKAWTFPEMTIVDKPETAWRGVHYCWFSEQNPKAIERAIRMAALFKFNHVVLENWGGFGSDRHPWYGWNGADGTRWVKRMAKVAKELNVELIPQINFFGHASLCRRSSGKHAALDLRPEYEPLFEPGTGWNWCLSNPETYEVQAELADEVWELFGRPKYFHIGCDEAESPTCPECRGQDYAVLFTKLVKFHVDRFAARGVKVMLWHDMLLKKGDERWKGFYANGKGTERALSMLPKNIVICDWFYGGKKDAYPTLDYFKAEGFDVLTCPWKDTAGTLGQGKQVAVKGLYGILATTWSAPLQDIGVAAAAAWGHGISYTADLQRNWRICGQLAGFTADDYHDFGFSYYQLPEIFKER